MAEINSPYKRGFTSPAPIYYEHGKFIGERSVIYLLKYWKPLAVAALLLATFIFGYTQGRESVITKQLRDDLNGAKHANEIRQDINRLPDGDAAKRLRSDW